MEILSRDYAWLDTGTHEALTEATEFVKAVEKRTGLKTACLEEVGFRMGFVSKEHVLNNVKNLKGEYYQYIKTICEN